MLISYLLDRSGGVIKIKKNDYLTDVMLFNLSNEGTTSSWYDYCPVFFTGLLSDFK